MDPNQSHMIELLREVHLIAFKEIERLNLRIVELETRHVSPSRSLWSSQRLPNRRQSI